MKIGKLKIRGGDENGRRTETATYGRRTRARTDRR
jgi:hypothetical protein